MRPRCGGLSPEPAPVVWRGVRKIWSAAAGVALVAALVWQRSTGWAAFDGRSPEPPRVVGSPAPDESTEGAKRWAELADDARSPDGRVLLSRETLRLEAADRQRPSAPVSPVARVTLPVRPSLSVVAEPSSAKAPLRPRAEVDSVRLPLAPVVHAPSAVQLSVPAVAPSSGAAGASGVGREERSVGVAADADALRTLVEMFASSRPRTAEPARSGAR